MTTTSAPAVVVAPMKDDDSSPMMMMMEDVELADGTTTVPSNASSSADDDDNNNNAEDVNSDDEEGKQETGGFASWLLSPKLLIGLALLGFIIFVIIDTATTGHVRGAVGSFLEWIAENTVAGFFLFAVVYLVATVLFIPGSILTLGAGFVFSMAFGLGPGLVLGSISVFVGASLGAIASFLLARYLLRNQVGRLSKKYAIFEALDLALKGNGLKIFCLLRLSPIIPFNAVNYIGGVSSVSLRDYVLALFAILPGTVLYVFLGASAGSLADSAGSGSDPTVTIVVIVVGSVLGILAIWLTTRYARKELNRVLEQRQAEAAAAAVQEATVGNDNNDDAPVMGDVEEGQQECASVADDGNSKTEMTTMTVMEDADHRGGSSTHDSASDVLR